MIGYMTELAGRLMLKGLKVAGRFLDRLLPDDGVHPAEYVAYREAPDDRTKLIPTNDGPDPTP